MEILTLGSNSKKDLQIIKEIALKFGMTIVQKQSIQKNNKFENLKVVAKRLDTSIKQNNISMQDVVEECRTVRKKNNG